MAKKEKTTTKASNKKWKWGNNDEKLKKYFSKKYGTNNK